MIQALFLCVFVWSVTAWPTKVVHTSTGPLEGELDLLTGVKKFLGIPYAKAPLGQLRFRNPMPVTPWSQTFKATKRGYSCPQFDIVKNVFLGDEDCLRLDVYVPEHPVSQPLPVFVWIYGGGWVLGDKWEFGIYDPEKIMAGQDFIVVAMNYRLSALGFLAMDALGRESSTYTGSSGNQALLDQVLALQWINTNIHAFGGDPTKITIGGESAGAFSVCWHLASPASAGLFSAALMESGTCDRQEFFRSFTDAASFSHATALAHNCTGSETDILACLRKVPVDRLISMDINMQPYHKDYFIPPLYPFMPWAATVDGVVLPDIPLNIIRAQKHNKVPLLIGTNQNEGNLFDFFLPKDWTKVFPALEMHFFPDPTEFAAIKAFYNISNTSSGAELKSSAGQIVTDYFFTCSTRRAIRALQQTDIWQYQFTFMSGLVEKLLGDAHGLELPFVFGHTFVDGGFTPKDHQMSQTFQHYWNNFIRLHEPSGSDSNSTRFPTWPSYGSSSFDYLRLDVPTTPQQDLQDDTCNFWDSLQ